MLLGGQKDENAKIFREMADNLLMEDVSIDDLLIDEDDGEITVATPEASAEAPSVSTPAPSASAPAPATTADGKLQPEYTPYARKHLRHVIDWKATARATTGEVPVRLVEISAGGLALETSARFEIGDHLTVVFDHVADRPTAAVTVARRIPRGYAVEGEVPSAVAELASDAPISTGNRLAG